jgi:U3 small nucleolar RNA-associated protein 15
MAVTSSTRVTIYDGATGGVRRVVGRFADKAYGARFRGDGKLLAAGGESGVVQVFDAGSRALLRQFKGHGRPVHAVEFSPDRARLASGGDDATLRLWDVGAGAQVARLAGHTDYVRCLAPSPASGDVWASGGYDHSVRLWDARAQASVAALDHGAPVEALAFFPSGALLATAGGAHVCVWDVLGGGRLLARVGGHQKTVTALAVARLGEDAGAAAGLRLLTGALDGHVRVFDASTFQVTHASRYAAPILSLALSPTGARLAVGMADGALAVRQRRRHAPSGGAVGGGGGGAEAGGRRARYAPRLDASSYRYFVRGQGAPAAATDYVVAARRRAALPAYDRVLRRFRYGEALDAALATRRPEVVAAVVEELAARGGLGAALGGRAPGELLPLAAHLRRHACDPRYAPALGAVAHRLLDAHGGAAGRRDAGGAALAAELAKLRERVAAEVRLQDALAGVRGMIEPLLSAGAM